MMSKKKLGQYFTTSNELKENVFKFIQNQPDTILEPSIGQGDLIQFVLNKTPNIQFDMYEIDTNITFLDGIEKDKVIYGDFMIKSIHKLYKTIIGNPPFIRTKKGNLYIDFTEKCYNLLEDNGELIFIVPSDFLKLTSSTKLLNTMMSNGTFTDIYHPHKENLFENASIDVIIFRYCKNIVLEKKVLYNDKPLYITNSNGLITFNEKENDNTHLLQDYFDVYVGIVSGKEDVYKNEKLGNIKVLNGENKSEKYILIEKFPCENTEINEYLLQHKTELMGRGIRKFNDNNWYQWGALRNISIVEENIGKDCIYVYNLTRKPDIAFIGKIGYFGGGLLMLNPKKQCDLNKVVEYLNSIRFKNNFTFSGRFKIGQRQLCYNYIPSEYLS